MGFFSKKKPSSLTASAQVSTRGNGTAQTRDSWDSPFSAAFSKYLPLQPDIMIYNIIREAIPLADAIIRKRARLLGDFRYDGMGNDAVQKFLDDFYRNVRVGQFGKGFRCYQNQVLDSVLCNGFSVSEVIPSGLLNGVAALKVGKEAKQDDKEAGKLGKKLR